MHGRCVLTFSSHGLRALLRLKFESICKRDRPDMNAAQAFHSNTADAREEAVILLGASPMPHMSKYPPLELMTEPVTFPSLIQ